MRHCQCWVQSLTISQFMVIFCCSLAEQLESIKESFDERSLSALSLFLECKKVVLSLCYFLLFSFMDTIWLDRKWEEKKCCILFDFLLFLNSSNCVIRLTYSFLFFWILLRYYQFGAINQRTLLGCIDHIFLFLNCYAFVIVRVDGSLFLKALLWNMHILMLFEDCIMIYLRSFDTDINVPSLHKPQKGERER